jgi:hypothetical protein
LSLALETASAALTIKWSSTATNSAGTPIGYVPPDEVWDITTTATFAPPTADAFPANSPYNGSAVSGGHAYVKFAPAHAGKLLRPLIFVDGIDFNETTYTYGGQVVRHGDTGWDVVVMGNSDSSPNPFDLNPSTGLPEASEFAYYPTAIQTLLNNGYDVVYLDFASGADYIQKNGLVLVKLLQMVNARKAADATGSAPACENAVMGASMGGQVAKWALSYMEENGLDHQAHTYISFDSPQRGAHIPLSLQAFALLADRSDQDEDKRWQKLNTPAARQMLLLHLGGQMQTGGCAVFYKEDKVCTNEFFWQWPEDINLEFPNTALLRGQFAAAMQGLGYPQDSRNVAISCGSNTGANQGISSNGRLFEAGLDLGVNPIQGICTGTGNLQLGFPFYTQLNTYRGGPPGVVDAFHITACQHDEYPYPERTLFAGFMPKSFIELGQPINVDVPCKLHYLTVVGNPYSPNLDNASGCSRTDTRALRKSISELGVPVIATSDKFSFMPTMSTLDINWPMDDQHLVQEINLDEIIQSQNTPFSAVFAPSVNLRHVELTPAMVTWLLNQLELGVSNSNFSLALGNGETFNFGRRKNKLPSVTIPGNAMLAVNLDGRVNYRTPSDPLSDKAHFDVYISGGCSDGRTVTVKSNGTLQIGDPQMVGKTGTLHAIKGSTVRVEARGILRISNASELRIYGNGKNLGIPSPALSCRNEVKASTRAGSYGQLLRRVSGNLGLCGCLCFAANIRSQFHRVSFRAAESEGVALSVYI